MLHMMLHSLKLEMKFHDKKKIYDFFSVLFLCLEKTDIWKSVIHNQIKISHA